MPTFYGILEAEEAWQVIAGRCRANREQFDLLLPIMERDGALPFCLVPETELYRDGREGIVLLIGENVAPARFEEAEDWDAFHALDAARQGKELFVPDDLLNYADDDYYEDTPEARAMLRFLKRRANDPEDMLLEILDGIRDVTVSHEQLLSDMIEGTGFKARSLAETQEFAELITALSNTTRMPCNRGRRPIDFERGTPRSISFGPGMREAIRSGEIDAKELMRVFAEQNLPDSFVASAQSEIEQALKPGEERWEGGVLHKGPKIGPNDPCPCGSGKKYKKCCGKNK